MYGAAGARFQLCPASRGARYRPSEGAWVIITAWNPQGQQVTAAQNHSAQDRLAARLHEHELSYVSVLNGEGPWQEPAFLVFGAALAQARTWLGDFDQAAVLYGVGARAALVWHSGAIERFWAVGAA